MIAAAAQVEMLRSLCGLSEPFLRRTNAIPRIDAISLKSIMEKADDLNMRFAYKTTVKVAGYGDSEVRFEPRG